VLKETWKEGGKDNISLVAAGVAFYAFTALVPLLTAFVLTYGLVAEPSSVVSHTQMLTAPCRRNRPASSASN
jgi:membrane protein